MVEMVVSICTFLLYFVVIAPSLIITRQATIQIEKGRKREFIILSLIAIIVPCIFSGFRGENVGVDVLGYAKPVYKMAESTGSLSEFLGLSLRYETGYRLIAYIAAHRFHSFNAQLLLTQLLINTPIYCGAILLRKRFQPWIIMLSFYCLFFVETFNIMRQGIGVAFAFLAFSFMIEKKCKTSAVFAVIGYFFHTTMIIGCGLLVFVYLFKKIKRKSIRVLCVFTLTIAVPVVMRFWKPALVLLAEKGLVPSQYVRYFITDQVQYFRELGTKNYFELAIRWIGVAIPLIFGNRLLKNKEDIRYTLFLAVLLGSLIYTSVFIFLHSSYGYRISFYLEILYILWLPSIYRKPNRKSGRFRVPLSNIVLFSSLILCFFVGYMMLGLHRTLPFYFQLY